jgi:hypothetical protein
MTTIEATSYYKPASRYTGTDRANGIIEDGAYADLKRDEEGAKTSQNSENTTPSIDSRPSSIAVNLQGKVTLLHALDMSGVKKINVAELPEDKYNEFMEANQRHIEANQKYLESQYTQTTFPDYSNDPRMQTYATITVAGQVVATIDNQGVVSTDSNALGDRINKLLSASVDGDSATSGPANAQYRADKIAELLGGHIVKAGTAMTQSRYNALPPFEQPTSTIDYDAMKNDPLYNQLQGLYANQTNIEQQRAEYLGRQ